MGAEGWMLAASTKEAEKIKAYLAPTDGEMGKEGEYGCWFEWHGKLRLEIGRTLWEPNAVCEAFIRRELARRFRFRRIGADSVGWYPEKEMDHPDVISRYGGPWKSWVEWAKNYRVEWTMNYRLIEKVRQRAEATGDYSWAEGNEDELSQMFDIEAFVVQQFLDLDEKAGVDFGRFPMRAEVRERL